MKVSDSVWEALEEWIWKNITNRGHEKEGHMTG